MAARRQRAIDDPVVQAELGDMLRVIIYRRRARLAREAEEAERARRESSDEANPAERRGS